MRKEFSVKLKYAVIIEKAPNNYAAYIPDLPGYIATAKTWDGMIETVREGIAVCIEDTLERGYPLPEPRSSLANAMRCHLSALDENDDEFYAEQGIELEDWEETETSFIMLEVEVAEPAPAALAAVAEIGRV